jgi:glycosyltransferase involved in cell wall biosynthesis
MAPAISVIVPIFNAMPYLKAMLASLLHQTIIDEITIIGVDDGSTDGSPAYIRNLNARNILLVEKEHSGIIDTFNTGLELVQTEFVARMDADDICTLDKFEKQLTFLRRNRECVIVGTSANHLSKDGIRAGWPVHMPASHEEILESLFLRRSAIIQPTTLMRTSAVKIAGGYARDSWPEDYDLYFRLAIDGGILANLTECLYSIRLHENSMTAAGMLKLQQGYEKMRLRYFNLAKTKSDVVQIDVRPSNQVLLLLDAYAVVFYRRGIFDFLNNRKLVGVVYLVLSGLCSPLRLINYVHRKMLKIFHHH